MPWVSVRDDLTYFEHLCLLLEASDAEELDDFRMTSLMAVAYHNPKRLKKWKFSSRDKAGTKKSGSPAEEIAKFALQMSGGNVSVPQSDQRAIEFARATGRPIAYRTEEGKLVDIEGNSVEKEPMMVIVPLRKS